MTTFRIRKMAWMSLLALVAATRSGAAAGEADGFLYGTVKTTNGSLYTDLLRWGGEEAFWDDLFQSAKE